MRKLILLAGAAAMAAAMPALAQGQGKGKGGGERQTERAAKQEPRGGGQGAERAQRQQGKGAERAQRDAARVSERADRQQGRGAERAQRQQREASARPGRGNDNVFDRAAREQRQASNRAQRDRREAGERLVRDQRRDVDRRAAVQDRANRDGGRDWSRTERERYRDGIRPLPAVPATAFGRHCPPGLARQNAFCMPPGQLRKAQMIGQRMPVAGYQYNIPDRYSYRFRDNDEWYYRYDDGHVYRFDRRSDLVSTVVPLLGSGLMVGQPMPLGYEVYNVPYQYRGYYADTDDYRYRYDDGAIYRVDPRNGLVEGVVALLTSGALGGLGGLGIGDQLPSGYDVYNVPLQHRDAYYDTPDHMYRYADGNLYQVDPQTRLIEQIISLIA
jgi:hypothetical protein